MRRVVVEVYRVTGRRVAAETGRVAMSATYEVKAKVQPEGNGGADGDGELLQRDQRSAQLRRCDLGLIQWDDHREHADAYSTNDASGEEIGRTLCTGLEASAKGEDDDGDEHRVLARDGVGQVAVDERTRPRTQLQRGHEPALDDGASQRREVGLKVLHDQNGAHDTLIVAVHHASQRREETGQEDVGVLEHAKDAMALLCIVPPDDRLTDGGRLD